MLHLLTCPRSLAKGFVDIRLAHWSSPRACLQPTNPQATVSQHCPQPRDISHPRSFSNIQRTQAIGSCEAPFKAHSLRSQTCGPVWAQFASPMNKSDQSSPLLHIDRPGCFPHFDTATASSTVCCQEPCCLCHCWHGHDGVICAAVHFLYIPLASGRLSSTWCSLLHRDRLDNTSVLRLQPARRARDASCTVSDQSPLRDALGPTLCLRQDRFGSKKSLRVYPTPEPLTMRTPPYTCTAPRSCPPSVLVASTAAPAFQATQLMLSPRRAPPRRARTGSLS